MTDAGTVGTILIIGMVLLLAIGAPISISVALPSALSMVYVLGFEDGALASAQRMFNGVNSFALLAIPFFILAGVIMNNGGIAIRLINLAKVMVGKTPAPLAQTGVLASMLFGAVSGSAVATAGAVGSTTAPIAAKQGYDPAFSAAANVAAAPSGLLIPPSNTLIIYALASGGTSVGALFMAGYIPGILWGLACMAVVYFYAKRHPELKAERWARPQEALLVFLQALPSLSLIVVVIGGIVSGFFTPTEGSAVAVVYALLLSFIYRSIGLKDLPGILMNAARTSSVVIFLIGVSTIMSFVMSFTRIPALLAESLFGWTDSKVVVLLIMMAVLLVIGIPLDATPAILIFTPIFLPIAVSYGVDPVHFGIMMVFNLSIAVISPPSAPVLFVGAQVAKVDIGPVIVKLMPFMAVLIMLLLLITFVPELSLWLPRLLGFL
ncbi:TRAP transporter large permease [Arthrobacter zhangbolii]|uniref:TRAP transporter large permease n=1 Tax=Arthrobacter zhangbolii TaxID=2886936 RepID=A0A9X1M8B2_9MICC|nr:TRAP transporter large permease [Arthrobacter zhangbolii]MCC3273303.1 TRAP transporter large permease [Arthrobacter zhangbolii]UON92714.1 TRAP transporter large permease [Arthrobacter zhangbolii]